MNRSVSSGGSSMGGRVSISKSQPGCPCPPPLTRRNVAWWIGNRCRPKINSPSDSICASRSHETLLPWQKSPAPTPGGPTRGQYPPHPGGTPAPSRPLPPVGRPGRRAPCPPPAALGRRAPVGDHRRSPVLLDQHCQPVAAAVREGWGGRHSRSAPRSEAVRRPHLGHAGRAMGADALTRRLSVHPQSVVLRGSSRRSAGGLPGPGRARNGPPLAAGRRVSVATTPPDHPPEGPGPGGQTACPPDLAAPPAGGRDGGVHGRGGREPQPEGRGHVDAAGGGGGGGGAAGGGGDAGHQREAVPGREHPLADRAGLPDRGEAPGGPVGRPVLPAPGRPPAGLPALQGHPR